MNEVLHNILTQKIGLTPQQARWTMMLSDKHAIWIANQIKANPGLFPAEGVTFQKIVDWKKKNPLVNIKQLTYQQVLDLIEKDKKSTFKEQPGSLKNDRVVAICHGSEFKWVEIRTKQECLEEGNAMKNCLRKSGDSYMNAKSRLFSLRNAFNKPMVTLCMTKGGVFNDMNAYSVSEYRGKANAVANPIYAQYFKFLVEQTKMEISVASAYAYGFPIDVNTNTFQQILDTIISQYRLGVFGRAEGDKKIATLINEAKRLNLRVNVSYDILEDIEIDDEEGSMEYDVDEHGSIIC